ncbi:DNA polymerase II [Thalassotalea piscium]|uniref:DNA polymerase n=1 Tax=Thalassotalea piscium TaxID=1230533 RepID=A0A7X0NK47_9GAMM|nr:DNA polymerase II [Thalassotalea piscium]MBB6544900.1 DNA polymerase-2 [Thalassotalea piscium]
MQISADKTSLYTGVGILLTRQVIDTPGGTLVYLWIKTTTGPVKLEISGEKPVFFIEQNNSEQAQHLITRSKLLQTQIKPLALKTFTQQNVVGVYFNKLRDFYLIRDLFKQHNIKCYEDDLRPDDRFLMERFITGQVSFIGKAIAKKTETDQRLTLNTSNYQYYQDVKCKRCDEPTLLSTDLLNSVSLDIECSMEGELYSIGLYSKLMQTVLMIGEPKALTEDINFDLVWVPNEKALLHALNQWMNRYDPDIIIGWNVINFDFLLLKKRFDHHNITFTIGRDGSKPRWRKHANSEQNFIDIAGRVVIDGIDMLRSATYSFPSFSLDYVANTLLGIGKKVDDVDNRVAEITDNFKHNKLALAKYNLEDCRLVSLIFDKTLLLDFAILRAHLTGLALDRIGGSVAAFTNLYLPKLHRSGYVAPNMGDGLQGLVSPGGYVMDSVPGLYRNVLVLDFKSLYPSIIRTFKIDPMGMIEGLKTPESSIEGFDGAYFSRDKHFLPDIIKSLWSERDKAKKDKNSALSQAIKIIMNSFYGVLGSTGCRFFDPRLSGSITKRSHEILKTTKKWIEQEGYQVIYGDTDSIFIHVGEDKSSKESQRLGKILAKLINNNLINELNERFNVTSELEIEFETYFSQFFMPTIRGLEIGSKKRYAGLVEKAGKQQLIFKGLESVRTDWTELAKEFQRTLYLKVFNQECVVSFIKQTVEKTYAGEFDDKLLYRKRIRRKLNHYVKNIPPHIKAARLADKFNKENNKPLKFQNKGWIEYYLTTSGPQAKGYVNAPLDYQLYVERQLSSVADAILPFIGTSFNEITDAQMNLFN